MQLKTNTNRLNYKHRPQKKCIHCGKKKYYNLFRAGSNICINCERITVNDGLYHVAETAEDVFIGNKLFS